MMISEDNIISIEDAIITATYVHNGRIDKGGQPYILHCLRVMLKMGTYEERLVAVLHDTYEDISLNNLPHYSMASEFLKELKSRLSNTTKEALVAITRYNDSYEDYIKRVSKNKLATKVKLADLEDNMNLDRLPKPFTKADLKRREKYQRAKEFLQKVSNANFG